jgi:hypothetical protein
MTDTATVQAEGKKARKQRSDKGQKRGKYRARTPKETAPTNTNG